MATEHYGNADCPDEFSDEEKMDHVGLMHDTLALLWSIHDQLEKADASKGTPCDIDALEYSNLVLRMSVTSRELRTQIRAAQPWIGALALADFDKRLPTEISEECETLILDYPTYRTFFNQNNQRN